MKIRAVTLIEQLIVVVVIGVIWAVIMTTMKGPSEYKKDALLKAGKSVFVQIEFATKNILAKDTNNYTLTRMVDSSGEFSIAGSSVTTRMLNIYKKRLVGLRTTNISSTYKSTKLTTGSTTLNLKPSDFSGFSIKNGGYFGIKLNGNCTTTISYIYDPTTPENKSRTNTCGIVFFDVNGDTNPNLLGVDQYIVALGKRGIK